VIAGFDGDGVIARIGSVLIKGQVLGLSGNASQFGFVSEQIGSFRYAGVSVPLLAGAKNDTFAAGKAVPVGPGLSFQSADGFAVHVFEV
jgi:hypothetical protein